MPDDEKPKRTKSWRDIDKQRDRGGSSRRSDRESERFQSSTKYTQYKTNLDRLFNQGVASSALPDHLREKLGGEENTDRALTRLEELQKAGALKVPPALSQRLASVEIESGDPALRRRAAELRKLIR